MFLYVSTISPFVSPILALVKYLICFTAKYQINNAGIL